MVIEKTKCNMDTAWLERVVLSLVIETQMVIFGWKLKETKAKNVTMVTSQYGTSLFHVGFKFQSSLSGDQYSSFHDLSPFSKYLWCLQFLNVKNSWWVASVLSCKNHNLSCRGKFSLREVRVTGVLRQCPFDMLTAEHLNSYLWYGFRKMIKSLQRRTLYSAM